MKLSKRLLVLVPLVALVAGLTIAGAASASRTQTVRCAGAADYCGATVSIAGGAKNRVVSVNLTNTNLRLIRVWGQPAGKSAFKISNAGFRLGGSVYRFTLNAWGGNPRGSRIVLLFGAGSRVLGIPGVGDDTITSHAIFKVGIGNKVSIVGGGGGTSNCTNDETNTTFTTTSNDEKHDFGFLAKSGGVCNTQLSWSWFRVNIRNPNGQLIGPGPCTSGSRTSSATTRPPATTSPGWARAARARARRTPSRGITTW